MRPGRKTGTRRAARRESAIIARVSWAGRAKRASGGGGGKAAAIVAVAAVVVVEEDILQTISITTS